MRVHFDEKLQSFMYLVPDSKVEYVKFEFVRGLKKSMFPDFCAPFSNEFVPASDTQVTNSLSTFPFSHSKNAKDGIIFI